MSAQPKDGFTVIPDRLEADLRAYLAYVANEEFLSVPPPVWQRAEELLRRLEQRA